jgi:hypothetical protein
VTARPGSPASWLLQNAGGSGNRNTGWVTEIVGANSLAITGPERAQRPGGFEQLRQQAGSYKKAGGSGNRKTGWVTEIVGASLLAITWPERAQRSGGFEQLRQQAGSYKKAS